jgi:hypothetical protein
LHAGFLLSSQSGVRRSSTERLLLARRGEHVSVDDIRAIGADVLRGMPTQMSDIITVVVALLALAFAITLGVLLTDL